MKECAKQYQYETDALVARYKIYGASLLDSAATTRETTKKMLAHRATNGIRQYEEFQKAESQKRIAEYWLANADEKRKRDRFKNNFQSSMQRLIKYQVTLKCGNSRYY